MHKREFVLLLVGFFVSFFVIILIGLAGMGTIENDKALSCVYLLIRFSIDLARLNLFASSFSNFDFIASEPLPWAF